MRPIYSITAGLLVVLTIAIAPHGCKRPRVERWFVPGVLGSETVAGEPRGDAVKRLGGEAVRGGALGSETVKRSDSDAVRRLSGETVKRSKGFTTRAMYGVQGEEGRAWSEANGLMQRLDFSHALNRIFPPELHPRHPEFFPLVNGERLLPPKGSYFWQPDLGREDVAAWAADAARRHFEAHPDAVSFAVGVNDGLIFGESEETMALVKSRKLKAESRNQKADRLAHGIHEAHGIPDPTTDHADEDGSKVSTGINHEKHETHERPDPTTDHADGRGLEVSGSIREIRGSGRGRDRTRIVTGPSALSTQLSASGSIHWFRERPDFTDLVYTFTNRVAADVARTHPDKYIGALAYYWCENAPSFPLEPNVIPFLTADRSQGYDEQFRAEERALQRAWARAHGFGLTTETQRAPSDETVRRSSGEAVAQPGRVTASLETADEGVRAPRTLSSQHSALDLAEAALPRRLGLYDYLYGSGFLIPRVHTRLIADNLRQARRLGFTDYFAELNPNWGLDGPMPWLVAQLLQDPEQSREELLEEYYTRYFREAAVPMRRFFERCEYQWMTQPGPAYWLKHYRNESQARLFPPTVCRELRRLLDEAGRQARDEITKKRVALVSETFGVTERFVAFCDSRDELNREMLKAESRKQRAESGNQKADRLAHGLREPQGKPDPTTDHADGDGLKAFTGVNHETHETHEKPDSSADRQDGRGLEAPAKIAHETHERHEKALRTERANHRDTEGTETDGHGSNTSVSISEIPGSDSSVKISGIRGSDRNSDRTRIDSCEEQIVRYETTRTEFVEYTKALMEREPHALHRIVWEDYLRHEPPIRGGAAGGDTVTPLNGDTVKRSGGDGARQRGDGSSYGFTVSPERRFAAVTAFRGLEGGVTPARTIGGLRYGVALPEGWQSYVEPSEFQAAEVHDGVLRLTGNKETFVYQWLPASAGTAYRARVKVRGYVSPSTTASLTLSWLDGDQKRLGYRIHRLPEGDWPEWVTLEAMDTAPEGAAWIGVGVRVQNQMGRDWVEARDFRLEIAR